MLFLNILLIPLSMIAYHIIGKIIIDKKPIYNFFFGWLLVSLILAFSSYFIPNYSRQLTIIIVLIFFFISPSNQIQSLKLILIKIRENYKDLILFFLFSYFLFIEQSIFLVKFLNNNLLHHGLAIEMLTADYLGNIMFPHHYPVKLGAFHLLSNSTLASLNIFSVMPNMHLIMETKLIITCLFLASFLFSISKIIKNKFKIILITLIFYLFFFSEIKLNYEIGSNYLFLIFSLFTIQIFHEPSLKSNEKFYLILLLLIIQFHSKAPIGYIFIPVGIYIFFTNFNVINKKTFWLISTVSLIVLINLVIMPKGNGWLKAQTEYKVVFTNKQSLASFVKYEPPFIKGSVELRIINSIDNLYQDSFIYDEFTKKLRQYAKSVGGKTDASIITGKFLFSFLIVFFLLLKFYLPLFYINNFKDFNFFKKEFNIFLITSILGWFLVRNSSGYNLSHQSYIYFYISTYAFSYLIYFSLLKKIKIKYLVIFFIYGSFNFILTQGHNFNYKNSYYFTAKQNDHYFDKKIENCDDKKFSEFIPDYTKLSSLIMSKGIKLYCRQSPQTYIYDEYFLHRSKKQNQ